MQNNQQDSRSAPVGRRHNQPGTYPVQGNSYKDELARLAVQDRMTTATIGGVLPEQPDPARLRRVLDVGCGTGGWLLDVARTYPSIELLIGVDISDKMVEYARTQAAEQLNGRVEFHVMDALRSLDFPVGYFDLVNLRFGTSYLRKWDWPNLLAELKRVAQPGGVIRIGESDIAVRSSSPTLARLFDLAVEALYNAGHFFGPGQKGVTHELAGIFERAGLEQIQQQVYTSEYRVGMVEMQYFIEDVTRMFQVTEPFLRKWTRVPDDYDALYQQMLSEIHQPDFRAGGELVIIWGRTPL